MSGFVFDYAGTLFVRPFERKVARREGLEPPTFWSVARCSIQLSHRRSSGRRILPHGHSQCKPDADFGFRISDFEFSAHPLRLRPRGCAEAPNGRRDACPTATIGILMPGASLKVGQGPPYFGPTC